MLKSVAAERDTEVQTQGADAAPGSGGRAWGRELLRHTAGVGQRAPGSPEQPAGSATEAAPPQVLVRTGAAGPVGRAAVPGALPRLPPQDAPSPTAGRHLLPECHNEGCHGARACVRGWSRGSRPSGGPASLPALQRLEAGHWLGTRPGVSRGPRVPSEDGPFSRSSVTSAVRAAASQGRSETHGRLAPDGRLGPEGRGRRLPRTLCAPFGTAASSVVSARHERLARRVRSVLVPGDGDGGGINLEVVRGSRCSGPPQAARTAGFPGPRPRGACPGPVPPARRPSEARAPPRRSLASGHGDMHPHSGSRPQPKGEIREDVTQSREAGCRRPRGQRLRTAV